ncbi:MAG TPA: EamA family transporter [Candidatus Saccharimonadales bacterium]|nr:EamA family transporter [Candidatus Saccharimonadales bacterium]
MALWILLSLGSAVFAALVAIFGKMGVAQVDSTLATTVRAIIMAFVLIGVSLAFGKFSQLNTINNKALYFIVLSGLAGAASWICYFLALKLGPAPAVASLDRLSVVFVLIFSVLFLADKLTVKSGFGAILITLGAILMTLK